MGKDNLHVVLVPWSAFGHLMPLFQLAVALGKAGVHASLVSTTRNIQRLPKPPPEAAGLVDLVALPRPPVDQSLLPEDAEATVDIPWEKIQYLKVAFDLLKTPFEEFISKQYSPPSWIISDFISPSWLVEVAQMHNIPVITFYPLSAASLAFFGPPGKSMWTSPEMLTVPPTWVDFPSTVAFRKHEADGMFREGTGMDASGMSALERSSQVFNASKAVALRSCPELESDYINLYAKIAGKPVFPLGLLPPEKSSAASFVAADDGWKKIFRWLDEQKPRSVVFVGFGSECKLSKDQVRKIAGGLELSKLPFLWSLQKPMWDDDEAGDVLPPGFTSRVAGKGVVRIGWAPQKEILSHPSIGASFFHSGWGSVIETLQHGHCLVVMPFIVDQSLHARFLVEKGLAVEVERNEEDGSFREDDIATALRLAIAFREGEKLRANAREAIALFEDSKNQGYVQLFVEYLQREIVE